MSNSSIMRGINFRTMTSPLRLAQGLQQVINRVSEVKKIIPSKKFDSIEEIFSSVHSEIQNYKTIKKSKPSKTHATYQQKSQLGKYHGLDDDAIFNAASSSSMAKPGRHSYCNIFDLRYGWPCSTPSSSTRWITSSVIGNSATTVVCEFLSYMELNVLSKLIL